MRMISQFSVRSSLFRKYYLRANIDMSVIEFINVVIRIINDIPFIFFFSFFFFFKLFVALNTKFYFVSKIHLKIKSNVYSSNLKQYHTVPQIHE